MRRRFTYANVAATLALVLAMSGGALAAGHYLINSTRQINPKVIRKLRGNRGATGSIGPVGPQGIAGGSGPKGLRGPQGEPGFSALSQLPSGKTESGDLTVSEVAEAAERTVSTAVTFPVPLATPIPAEKVEFRTASAPGAHCLLPGTAPAGFLCVYISSELNVMAEPPKEVPGHSYNPEVEPVEVGSGKFGVGFNWMSKEAGVVRITGTWTVTAP